MKDRFQVLCLDGGGIKGLFSAAFLSKIEKDLNTNIRDHFDLIVGTSTGGIIALGLGLGLPLDMLVEFYFKKGHAIFNKIPLWTGIKNLLLPKYSGESLESIFREKTCFGEKLLGHSTKRLVIPSYNIDSGDVYVFKTAHHERFRRDYRVPVWKIARATSAAPTYFSVCNSVDNIRLIDGGVWANNPVMVGLIEAVSVLEVPSDQVRLLSVGTTEELRYTPKLLSIFGGWPFWAKTAVELIMQAQSVSISAQASLMLSGFFERVSPKVPKGLFRLDKLNMKELFSFAANYSRDFAPIFKKKFLEHLADEFIPSHKL